MTTDLDTAGSLHPPLAASRARSLRTLIGGGVRSALAIGPGYEPQPLGPHASFDGRVDGYYVDLRRKTFTKSAALLTGRGHVYEISAAARAQRALGWWDRHLAGEAGALRSFLNDVEELLRAAERVSGQLLWRYDVDVPKYRRGPPWYSCMAQGQAASVLVRAYAATEDACYADGALAALRPLIDDHGLGLVTATPHGPVLEECPSEPRSHILNGWIFALWGLWDVAAGCLVSEAAALFEASAGALRAHLKHYDVGWWSLYSLFPGRRDIATPFYHRAHVTQLEVMYRLTGWRDFHDVNVRWGGYDRRSQRMRAVSLKGLAVISDLRERDRNP